MWDLLKLINDIKIASAPHEIEIWVDKKTFDELKESGFPLKDFRCKNFELYESRIMIVPCEPKPVKIILAEE